MMKTRYTKTTKTKGRPTPLPRLPQPIPRSK